MICIFSISSDYTTTEVMKWLFFLGKKDILRINSDEKESILIDISEDRFSFTINDRKVSLNDIEAVWYRKGSSWVCNQFYEEEFESHPGFSEYLNGRLNTEKIKLSEFFHTVIGQNASGLGSYHTMNLNKLIVLETAKKVGFPVPNYYIVNTADRITEIQNNEKEYITKAVSDGIYFFDKSHLGVGYNSYTEKLDRHLIENIAPVISPSLIQENIRKKIELRVFFLEKRCYSMAIFSQADGQTKVDYRRYNEEKPNRFVPFRLPAAIKKQVRQLFKLLKLNTGSVDFIVDEQDNYFFLEINPVGQFAMVSEPCNYFLEKKVALNLIDHGSKRRRTANNREKI